MPWLIVLPGHQKHNMSLLSTAMILLCIYSVHIFAVYGLLSISGHRCCAVNCAMQSQLISFIHCQSIDTEVDLTH